MHRVVWPDWRLEPRAIVSRPQSHRQFHLVSLPELDALEMTMSCPYLCPVRSIRRDIPQLYQCIAICLFGMSAWMATMANRSYLSVIFAT